MRGLFNRNSRRRNNANREAQDVEALHAMHAVEPDADVQAEANGGRETIPDVGGSAINDPKEWATEKRRSLGRRSQHSSRSNDVSPHSRSAASLTSRASFDDIYSDEVAVESLLNPDVEHQIDADSDEYDEFNLPKPGTTERAPRAHPPRRKPKSPAKSGSTRLSSRLSRLVGGAARSSRSSRAKSSSVSSSASAATPPAKDRKKAGTSLKQSLVSSSKRVSFRKANPERDMARAAKLRDKQDKKDEERRLREIRSNPWYPAGVDFKFLSPKPVWIPFLGRKSSAAELDFGNEARLVGATA